MHIPCVMHSRTCPCLLVVQWTRKHSEQYVCVCVCCACVLQRGGSRWTCQSRRKEAHTDTYTQQPRSHPHSAEEHSRCAVSLRAQRWCATRLCCMWTTACNKHIAYTAFSSQTQRHHIPKAPCSGCKPLFGGLHGSSSVACDRCIQQQQPT